jgi:hypothetical protein
MVASPTLLAIAMASLPCCVPMLKDDLPNGDHAVTTYVRLQGFEEARDDNLWAARQTCGARAVVLVDEQHGTDDNGMWDRLVYGCVAPRTDGAR